MQRNRFISTVVAGACGGIVSTGSPGRSQALTAIRAAAAPASDVTPLLYATRGEMFKKAGLDVQWLSTRSGAAVMATLVGGGVEIGHVKIVSLLQARDRGVDISIVAPGASVLGRTRTAATRRRSNSSRFRSRAAVRRWSNGGSTLRSAIPVPVVLKTPGNDSEESLDPTLMQPLIDAAAKYKFISKPFPASQLVFAGLR